MAKHLPKIGQKLFEFISRYIIIARKMINYILSITIEAATLSKILILIGTVILVFGVLSRGAVDVINSSILADDQPGLLVAIFLPDNILSFIREKNRVILGIIIICIGFYYDLSSETYQKFIFIKLLLFSLFILYLLCSVIAGFNRSTILNDWKSKNCRYKWLITELFTKKYLHETLKEFAKTDQSQEFMEDTLRRLKFVRDALGIERKFKGKAMDKPSISEIEIFQDGIRNEIENTSILYYLFKPKKLLNAFW